MILEFKKNYDIYLVFKYLIYYYFDMNDSKIWVKPAITILGDASELIQGGIDSDPKSTDQPDDNVFVGFSAGTV